MSTVMFQVLGILWFTGRPRFIALYCTSQMLQFLKIEGKMLHQPKDDLLYCDNQAWTCNILSYACI